jgi:hypothetical protein
MLPRIALAIAALAAIATSAPEPQRWSVYGYGQLQLTALDTSRPTATYGIKTEIFGEGPYAHLVGDLTVTVNVRSETTPTSTVTLKITLVDNANPENVDIQFLTLMNNGVGSVELTLPVWRPCETTPNCGHFVETQRLTIERTTPETTPALFISGSANVIGSADGKVQPPDARTTVMVTLVP